MRWIVLVLTLVAWGCSSSTPLEEPPPSTATKEEAQPAAPEPAAAPAPSVAPETPHVPTDLEEIARAHRLLPDAQAAFSKAEVEGTSDEAKRLHYGRALSIAKEIFRILEPICEKPEFQSEEFEGITDDLSRTAMLRRAVNDRLKALGPPPPEKD